MVVVEIDNCPRITPSSCCLYLVYGLRLEFHAGCESFAHWREANQLVVCEMGREETTTREGRT